MLVDAAGENVLVPRHFVEDNRIVLNIRPEAVQNLVIDDAQIQFDARFSGTPMRVNVPMQSILALFARENGFGLYARGDDGGMIYEEGNQPGPPSESVDSDSDTSDTQNKAPFLKVVK